MKNIKTFILATVLLLIPLLHQVQSAQNPGAPPPVEPVLVRQGDFALSLMEVFDLGKAFSESQAQEKLADIGIEPKNGWISDYPVTPDIIGELQDAVGRASDNGYLTMNRPDALNIFQTLTAEYGLSIVPDYGKTQTSEPPPSVGYYDYTDPAVINNYYYHSGPPVVTYYPPPYGHYHLYSWVPYPFWWGSYRFSGYFVLSDFHRTSHVVILNRYGHRGYFKGHRRVTGIVSNRAKGYRHIRKGAAVYPYERNIRREVRTGSDRSVRRWSGTHESGTRDNRFWKDTYRQRDGSGNNAFIRRENRSHERFRDKANRHLNDRYFRNPGRDSQRIEERTRRTRMEKNPGDFRKPENNRGSENVVPPNPMVREDRRNPVLREKRAPGKQENPIRSFRENRNPDGRENRKGFERHRSYDGNRSFQERDRRSFQRIDKSGRDFTRSWNRGDRGGREMGRQNGFSR